MNNTDRIILTILASLIILMIYAMEVKIESVVDDIPDTIIQNCSLAHQTE